MVLLLGWQFTLAEFVGGPLMIVILAVLFKAFLRPELVGEAREQAERGLVGSMEGHAEMDIIMLPSLVLGVVAMVGEMIAIVQLVARTLAR